RDGRGARRVGLVGAAGQLQVDRPRGAVRVQDLVAGQGPARRGAAEAALAAEPVVAGALHHTAAGRAGPGVVLPHLSGGDPDHVGEEDAAHTTSGSSALATMTALEPASPSRQFSASIRVSAARSSWSRERLSRAMHFGSVAWATPTRYFSSTSMTPKRDSAPAARAEVMPAGMLAPRALETTGPAALSASAMSRVVVVLPLVAETRVTSRCWASRASRSGSSFSATRPPITEPLPRPAARDAAATALPAVTASLARGVSGSELPAISSRSSLRTRRAGGGRPRGVGLSLSRALRTPEPRHR